MKLFSRPINGSKIGIISNLCSGPELVAVRKSCSFAYFIQYVGRIDSKALYIAPLKTVKTATYSQPLQ
jgi:hypothetical protein